MNPDHLSTETLSAYADGELQAVALARVERHLAECDACRATMARLRSLIAAARVMPREIAAPADAWAVIRKRLTSSEFRVPSRWWHNGWLASAAALVLVVGTALLVSSGPGKAKGAKFGAPSPTPIVLASVEKHFVPTITELREAFDAQRGALSPRTVQILDRSLAVIDSAIADARMALAADPASAALADMLAAYYERKIEFLKRATTLQFSM